MGDLEELRFEGRSPAWYWRQTLVAVASHFAHDIRSHKLLALRGLILVDASMKRKSPQSAGFQRFLRALTEPPRRRRGLRRDPWRQ